MNEKMGSETEPPVHQSHDIRSPLRALGALAQPERYFAEMPRVGGYREPFVWIFFWGIFQDLVKSLIRHGLNYRNFEISGIPHIVGWLLLSMFLHSCYKLLGGRQQFQATARTVASLSPLGLIFLLFSGILERHLPATAILVVSATVWIYYAVTAGRIVHNIPAWRASLLFGGLATAAVVTLTPILQWHQAKEAVKKAGKIDQKAISALASDLRTLAPEQKTPSLLEAKLLSIPTPPRYSAWILSGNGSVLASVPSDSPPDEKLLELITPKNTSGEAVIEGRNVWVSFAHVDGAFSHTGQGWIVALMRELPAPPFLRGGRAKAQNKKTRQEAAKEGVPKERPDLRLAAIELVKSYPLPGGRGTIARRLQGSVLTNTANNSTEGWTVGAVDASKFLVQRTLQSGVTYLFTADVLHRTVDGKNSAAVKLLAENGSTGEAVSPNGAISEENRRLSQQHYLSGLIFFQKGDQDKARAEWGISVQLDPSNSDAEAVLKRVERSR